MATSTTQLVVTRPMTHKATKSSLRPQISAMLNSPQPNGSGINTESMAQPQRYILPMVRAPIPGHIREQLRPSMPYEPQSAAPRSNTSRQGQVAQKGRRDSFQKPQPNYQTALSELQQTVQDQYAHLPQSQLQYAQLPQSQIQYAQLPQPQLQYAQLPQPQLRYAQLPQSQLQYAQRQTHLAEYGRLPPTITTPPTTDITTFAPFHMQQFSPQIPTDTQAAPSPTSTQKILIPHTGVEATGRGTSADPPMRRYMEPSEQSSLSLIAQAEEMAFDINKRTGLNRFGAPYGYLPANFVDKIPGAWDIEGTLKWVPSWMREER